ncbi:MAG: aspartate/glutamate racemase family protein [Bacteroidales bacterium]|jgi:aspartate racemase|nr:aspartate/glutamate racemase family protein [Bacteroidales bacterium]
MKTIGLLGGMSWESSAVYYQLINQKVKEILGGSYSAKSIMYSVEFNEIVQLQHAGNWEKLTEIMIDAAQNIEKGGADLLVICTNTMHKMAPEMSAKISIPIIHIADATAEKIKEKGINKIGLLGTIFTMTQDFYKGHLEKKHGLEVIIPNEIDRQIIHNIIYQELILGNIKDESRQKYQEIIEKLHLNGAQGVILGCTEIPLLITQKDSQIPIFDTTKIHAEKAVEFALKNEKS